MHRYADIPLPSPTSLGESASPPYRTEGSKKRLNLTVSAGLLERAKREGLNLSQLFEESLSQRLRRTEAERWYAENREAIDAYNERVERDGLWNKGITPWYS